MYGARIQSLDPNVGSLLGALLGGLVVGLAMEEIDMAAALLGAVAVAAGLIGGRTFGSMLRTGSVVHTDGWRGYPGAHGVTHEPHVIGPIAAHVVLPWTHRVCANLKRWALGVYHGLRRKHLQSYLDEFTFRFPAHLSISLI